MKKYNNKFVMQEAFTRLCLLRRVRGPNKYWREKGGRVYAQEFQIEERGAWITVVLLGKGTDLYKGMVSTHDEIIFYTNNFSYPILKALRIHGQQIEFFFIKPQDFVDNMERLSKWKTMVSANFDAIKIPWNPLDYILDVLK